MQTKGPLSYQTLIRHMLFWLGFILYQAVNEGWQDKEVFSFSLEKEFLTDVPISITLAYVNLYCLMPAFYYRQKYVQYAAALMLLLLAGGITERFCTYAIWVPWDKVHDVPMYLNEYHNFWLPLRIVRNGVRDYPVVLVSMLLKLMRNAYEQEKRMREMEKEKFSAELSLLKAQINPHFFFNTLNSLYALTLKGSEKASEVVLRLSELMHYMLYEASDAKVLLQDEIRHLENYIGIEQMRFADRVDLSFQHSGEIAGKMIAPLLLLPFVENAFKHGVAGHSGWITINIKVTGSRLFLKVENSSPQIAVTTGKGLGLRNVKRRLELSYPGQYQLQLNHNSGAFEAELKIDL